MNNYFFELDLPKDPLIDHTIVQQLKNDYNFFENVDEVCNPDLLLTLRRLNLQPSVAILFLVKNSNRYDDSPFIHSDLTWVDGKWEPVPFAINWELNKEITTTITWYNTERCKSILPTENNVDEVSKHLNGIWYDGEKSSLDCVTITANNELQKPILFNTSIPHAVKFSTPMTYRCALSLRFANSFANSWKKVSEIFNNN